MLELIINSRKEGSCGCRYISEIRDDDTVLAKYDENALKINLDVCEPYIGQEFKISTYTEEYTKKKNILKIDTTGRAILRSIEDENGLKYLKYDTIEPDKEQFL